MRRIKGAIYGILLALLCVVMTDRVQAAVHDVWEVSETADSYEEERERLDRWLERAREAEAKLTGEEPEEIPDERFFAKNWLEHDLRLITAVSHIEDTKPYTVYVIGVDIKPMGTVIASQFDGVVYSNLLKQKLVIGNTAYYVAEFAVVRSFDADGCAHIYEQSGGSEAGCLEKGFERYQCVTCGEEQEVILPALGHRDLDADTVCDRCLKSLESADEEAEPVHWSLGDIQAQEIAGETYYFECIDQNYSDSSGTYQDGALFLCTEVIPANIGSQYVFERQEDGIMGDTFVPGPIVNFGDTNDYKESRVHGWLSEMGKQFFHCETIQIGVDRAYRGATANSLYGDFDSDTLQSISIGYQHLTGELFCLSVDEAIKYRQDLWRFEGADAENPETQIGTFCKAYWLRNPMENVSHDSEIGQVYVVDLVDGTIRPHSVKPVSGSDAELRVTTSVGVRPAFVMPQD